MKRAEKNENFRRLKALDESNTKLVGVEENILEVLESVDGNLVVLRGFCERYAAGQEKH